MAQKSVLKFSSIANYFTDEIKLIARGENALESGHVYNMQFDDALKLICGSVYASMKDKLYKVKIFLDEYSDISKSSCTCPRGKVTCHHVAALAMFSHYNISITDKACSWTAKKPAKSEEVKTVEDLFSPPNFVASKSEVSEEAVDTLRKDLNRFGGNVGFAWLLGPKIVSSEVVIVVTISEIIFSEEYLRSLNKSDYFKEKLQVSQNQIIDVANATVQQNNSPLWLKLRKFRLTASNFGTVLAACRRNRYPPSLFKRLTGTYNLDGVRAIQWGRENEKNAVEAFSAAMGLRVVNTGLWLDECGYIGASPDGLVGEDGIIEIKCPFKYRESDLQLVLEANQSYILRYEKENKKFQINTDHEYYQQIQGQLHILKKKLCYLVIWTMKTIVIEIIKKEDSWKSNLDTLKNFYLNIFLKHVANMEN